MGKGRQRNRNRGSQHPRRSVITNRAIGKWTLVLSVLTFFAAIVFYYLAYGNPDLRFVHRPQTELQPPRITDSAGQCFHYITLQKPFKNLSFKTGFIKDVQFSPITTDVFAEFKLISIDRTPLRWNQQRDVEIKFSMALPPSDCERIESQGKSFKLGLFFYDNVGNQLTQDVDDKPFPYSVEIKFPPRPAVLNIAPNDSDLGLEEVTPSPQRTR